MQRFLPKSIAAAAISLLIAGASATIVGLRVIGPKAANAQSGFCLVCPVERDQILRHSTDNGITRKRDRYKLTIPAQDVAVAEVLVSFEPKFDGTINPERARFEVEGEPVETDLISWSEEFNVLEVVLTQPVAAGQEMRVVLPGVRNPKDPGFYRIQARVRGTEANPTFRWLGEWNVSFDAPFSRRS
ncbi:MAG: DUF2808 domain-containing protein [Synechococcus sp.]